MIELPTGQGNLNRCWDITFILLSTFHSPSTIDYSSQDVCFERVQKVFSSFINFPGVTTISEDRESQGIE